MKLKCAGVCVALLAVITWQLFAVHTWGAERVQTNLAVLTIAAALWFMFVFAREPWWRTQFGWSLMLIAVALLLGAVATALYRTFGDYPGRDIVLVVSADIALAAMVIRTLVLLRARRRGRGKPPEEQLH